MSVSDFLLSLVKEKEDKINEEWSKGVFDPKVASNLVSLSELCKKSKNFIGWGSLGPEEEEKKDVPNVWNEQDGFLMEDEEEEEEEEPPKNIDQIWDDYEQTNLKRILDDVEGKKRVSKRVNYTEDVMPDLELCEENGIEWFLSETTFGRRIMDELRPIIAQTGLEVENSSAKDSFLKILQFDDFTVKSCRRNPHKCFLCDLKRGCSLKITFHDDGGEVYYMGSECGKVVEKVQLLHQAINNYADLEDPEIHIMQAVESIEEAHFAKSRRKK